jgi:hypothetical protein
VGNGAGNHIVHIRTDRLAPFGIGSTVRFNLDMNMVRFFDPKTEKALPRAGEAATAVHPVVSGMAQEVGR